MAARDICIEHDIKVTGTIGILCACVRDRHISPREADEALAIDNKCHYE